MLGSIYGVYTSRSPHEPDGVSTQAPQAPTRVLKPTRNNQRLGRVPSIFVFIWESELPALAQLQRPDWLLRRHRRATVSCIVY